MTAYFDEIQKMIRAATTWDELFKVDEKVVIDCSTASMQPEFPQDLRDAIDDICLQYSIFANQRLMEVPWTGPTNAIGSEDQYREYLLRLEFDLHSVFHERARRDRTMGDGPLTWIGSLFAEAEERREQRAELSRGKRARPTE